MKATQKKIKVLDGHVPGTFGVVKCLPVFLEGLNIAFDLLINEKLPKDIGIRLLNFGDLQDILDFGTLTVTLNHTNETKKSAFEDDMSQKVPIYGWNKRGRFHIRL